MSWFTKVVTVIFEQLFIVAVVLIGTLSVAAQSSTVQVTGDLLCDKKDKSIVTMVNVYRYYHLSKSTELMEQIMVKRDGKFKVDLELDNEYIIDVASNTGVHKRINLNTEVLEGYYEDSHNLEFAVDLMEGDKENPEDVAWIYFDPSKNGFEHTDQIPVAYQGE